MPRYRKLPVEIEATQWTGDNEAQLREWTNHQFEPTSPGDYDDPQITAIVYDELHSTWIGLKTGDQIIRGVKGEYYPCAADVFAETHGKTDDTELAGELLTAGADPILCVGCYIEHHTGQRPLENINDATLIVDGNSTCTDHLQIGTAPAIPGRTPSGLIINGN